VPHSHLLKWRNALCHHQTREAIAAKILQFDRISGTSNSADLLGKHGGFSAIWDSLKPLLFRKGDTAALVKTVKDDGR